MEEMSVFTLNRICAQRKPPEDIYMSLYVYRASCQ